MNKFLTTIIYFVFSLIAINYVNAQSTSSIGFDSVVIHKIAGPCKNNDASFCFTLNITYPHAIISDTIKQNILNRFIERKVIMNLAYDTIYNYSKIRTVDKAIKLEIEGISNDEIKHGIGLGNKWENDIRLKVIYQNNDYITFFLDYFEYTGGGRGLSLGYYYTVTKSNFKQVFISDIVTDTVKLNAVGEKLFRQIRNLPPNESLNDAGFFNNESFYLSKNFGIINDTLFSFYNEYEIMSGAGIGSELSIPFTTFADILKEPFKHEVQEEK